MTERRLLLETALLPTGWATDVALDIADSIFDAITRQSPPAIAGRLPRSSDRARSGS